MEQAVHGLLDSRDALVHGVVEGFKKSGHFDQIEEGY